MKKVVPVFLVALVLFSAVPAGAIDRGARLIDTIGVESTVFDGTDAVSGTLWGETIISDTAEDWTFLIGGTYGTVSPHLLDDINFWSLGFGLKYYMFPLTSIAVTGQYGQYDLDGNPDVREVTARLKQRLLPAEAGISPFVIGGYTIRSADSFSVLEDRNRLYESSRISSDSEIELGVGVDLSMTDNMVIAIQIVLNETENLEDAWVTSLGMTYYWE